MERTQEIKESFMIRFVKQFENRSRFTLIAIAFVIIAVIGLVDYLTGHEISFSVFYLLGVALAVWFIGKWFGALVSLLSVAVWVGCRSSSAVGDATHIYCHWRKRKHLAPSYDEWWIESGGKLAEDGMFDLPARFAIPGQGTPLA